MKNTSKEIVIFERKRRNRNNYMVKTRVYKGYQSIYQNTPSREIKKWFEMRRF